MHIIDIMSNLFLNLFSKYRCLVHTSIGNDEYFHVAGKLESKGIKFKVRTRYTSGHGSSSIGRDSSQYDFFVQKSDEPLAYEVIQSK